MEVGGAVKNVLAGLVQYLSAKVGVATGRDLPELCRELFPRTVTRLLWGQAELIADEVEGFESVHDILQGYP